MKELDIPPIAKGDPKGLEIARIWAARGQQHVVLRTGLWKDPTAWGLMLVDLAKHVANAYAEDEGMDREEVLAKIKNGFDMEWDSPTDEATGGIMHNEGERRRRTQKGSNVEFKYVNHQHTMFIF